MKTKLLRGALLASLVAVPALVSGVAVEPAAATGTPAGDTALEVSVSRDGAVRVTNLECHPAGGDHPKAAEACAQLEAVDGNFHALDQRGASPCTLQYAPVTVKAHGTWKGRTVQYEQTFSNDCVRISKTGAVFEF
mgnify:CR=1 FL=1